MKDDVTPKVSENGIAFTLTQPSPSGGGHPQAVLDARDKKLWTEEDGTKLTGFNGGEGPCAYIAVLKERGSGTLHEYKDRWEHGQASLISMWKSGNYSCDCNRAIFISGDSNVECPCGDDEQFILVELRIVSDAQIFDMRGNGSGGVCPTLTREAAGDRPSDYAPMVFQQNSRSEVRLTNGDGKITGAVTSGPGAQCQNYVAQPAPKCFTQNQAGDVLTGDVAAAMGTNANATGRNTAKVNIGASVRRLTPEECESLQGFKRGYTKVPFRGKPAADGPRYKAIGNSMAVPVMAFIGKRIDLVEKTVDTP